MDQDVVVRDVFLPTYDRWHMPEEPAHDPPLDDKRGVYSPQECFEAWDIVVQSALAASELFGIFGQPSLFKFKMKEMSRWSLGRGFH